MRSFFRTAISIIAADRLRVITPTGSIRLTGTDGALTGTLSLTGDIVYVGSQQAATDIEGLGDVAARSVRLGQNDGEQNDAGYIQANGLRVRVGTGLFVQNSGVSNGAPADRRGFTTGSGGIDFGTGEDNVEVAINGRIDQGNGSFLTGANVLASLIEQNDRLDVNVVEGSTINGCSVRGDNCGDPTGPIVPPGTVQISDVLRQLTLLASQTPDLFQFTFQSPQLISFTDLEPFKLPPRIDEPVTGAGNDAFWAGIGFGKDTMTEIDANTNEKSIK